MRAPISLFTYGSKTELTLQITEQIIHPTSLGQGGYKYQMGHDSRQKRNGGDCWFKNE